MRKTSVLAAALFVLAFCCNAMADFDQLIEKIDKAWMERSADPSPMKESITLAEQAYGEKPGYDAAWRAARACFWICDRTENTQTKTEFGKRGYEWGEKAMKANPDGVDGYFWYGCCLGEYSKGISIVTALAKGLGSKYENAINKAISINAAYDHGGPNRAMGMYWFKLPWPKYNARKAEENYLASLKIGPQQARTHYYLAELYAKEKKYDKARETLDKMEALDSPYPDEVFDFKYYKKVGKDLYEQIKTK